MQGEKMTNFIFTSKKTVVAASAYEKPKEIKSNTNWDKFLIESGFTGNIILAFYSYDDRYYQNRFLDIKNHLIMRVERGDVSLVDGRLVFKKTLYYKCEVRSLSDIREIQYSSVEVDSKSDLVLSKEKSTSWQNAYDNVTYTTFTMDAYIRWQDGSRWSVERFSESARTINDGSNGSYRRNQSQKEMTEKTFKLKVMSDTKGLTGMIRTFMAKGRFSATDEFNLAVKEQDIQKFRQIAKELKTDDIIEFGTCSGYNIERFGMKPDKSKFPIRWKVLQNTDEELFLVSTMRFAPMKYGGGAWDKSKIRKWLNSKFVKTMFNQFEKEQIQLSRVYSNGANSADDLPQTDDYVFLLNCKEVKNFSLLKDNHIYNDSLSYMDSWLRNHGSAYKTKTIISYSREIKDVGGDNKRTLFPAMRIQY